MSRFEPKRETRLTESKGTLERSVVLDKENQTNPLWIKAIRFFAAVP